MKKIIATAVLGLCIFCTNSKAQTNVSNGNNATNDAPPSLPLAIPGINLNFLTNIPTVTNFAAMTLGLETGIATENSEVANYIKGDFYFKTNWMVSGEIQNAPVSTILNSGSVYFGYRKVWANAEVYAQGAFRRTFSKSAVPPSWQGGALFGASWFPMTGGHVAATASFALLTSPNGNAFGERPNLEVRVGGKLGF